MIPYQKASEKMRHHGEGIIKTAKAAGSVAAGAGAYGFGQKLIYKALPFLSGLLPVKKAVDGLSKLDPRIGKFVKSAMDNGQDFDQVREFITDKIEGAIPQEKDEISQEKSSDLSDNPIERISPGLHQFILSEVGKGKKPIDALHASKSHGFLNDIEKVGRKLGTRLFDVINSLYSGNNALPESEIQKSIQPLQQNPQGQMAQQQPGQGQQALMGILQKIAQSRGVQ